MTTLRLGSGRLQALAKLAGHRGAGSPSRASILTPDRDTTAAPATRLRRGSMFEHDPASGRLLTVDHLHAPP